VLYNSNQLARERSSKVAWSEVYRRLENARAAIERGFAPAAEERKKILKARAKLLAQESGIRKTPEEHLKVVLFLLAGEKYAIESAYVREVCPLKELTPLPCTPPFVQGIINIRGQVLSVIDFKYFFDLPGGGALTDPNKVIIVNADEMEFAILADAILGVQTIPQSEIQPSIPTLTGIRAEYLKGVTSERLAVLNMAKILFDERIVINEVV